MYSIMLTSADLEIWRLQRLINFKYFTCFDVKIYKI